MFYIETSTHLVIYIEIISGSISGSGSRVLVVVELVVVV